MTFQNRLEIEVRIERLYLEHDPYLRVTAKEQNAIPKNCVTQRWRRLIQNQHTHIVDVQNVHQPAHDFEASVETSFIAGPAVEQHGYVHIAYQETENGLFSPFRKQNWTFGQQTGTIKLPIELPGSKGNLPL